MNECLALRRRRRNKQSGRRAPAQVLVLFALCLPVLVGTAALLVDLTILLRDYAQLHQVAAAAARAGAQETSSLWLYATNTFTLVGAEGPARAAAERVCSAYRRGGLPGVQCAARVSAMEVSPFRREPGLAAAWTLFRSRDRPTSGPGQTIHGGVTVTASRIFRPLFVDVLVGNAGIPLRAEATAVLVTGP